MDFPSLLKGSPTTISNLVNGLGIMKRSQVLRYHALEGSAEIVITEPYLLLPVERLRVLLFLEVPWAIWSDHNAFLRIENS